MKIIETYSHLNDLEFLLVHQPNLWQDLIKVVASVDAEACKTKVSKEKRTLDKVFYSPIAMNECFKNLLTETGWNESRVSYWVTKNEKLIRKTLPLEAQEQKREIEDAGELAIFSYNQTDFVKERVQLKFSLVNTLLLPTIYLLNILPSM